MSDNLRVMLTSSSSVLPLRSESRSSKETKLGAVQSSDQSAYGARHGRTAMPRLIARQRSEAVDLRAFFKNESGATAIEYGMIAAGVCVRSTLKSNFYAA